MGAKKEKNILTHPKARNSVGLGTGYSHHLKPVVPLDLDKISDFDEMVTGMKGTAFGGRNLGEAADVLEAMVRDKRCFKVLTLSGAMTVAKMGLVICKMIDEGMVDAVISTGALVAHGFVESAGMKHFKYESNMDDKKLYYAGYDRVYDTLELEVNLDEAFVLFKDVLETFDPKEPIASHEITRELGKFLHNKFEGKGILKSAFEKNVPFYIPAFSDSEMGLDFASYNRVRKYYGKTPYLYDGMKDLEHYANNVYKADRLGIFTIGGGVPRNWAQQVGPYLDLAFFRQIKAGVPEKALGEKSKYFKRFQYAVRICPEPVHWGGLSGCTYSEGVSWGKFVPKDEGGMWSEVLDDATIAWPLIIKAVLERLRKDPIKK
ncbi:MAG: deoxyhypusine synthase family protein [Candidatus Micrarchaeota archaeon]